MTYDVGHTPSVFVDHAGLHELKARCATPGQRIALVGLGEYAKHLVNWSPENIVAIYDPDPLLEGVSFRGIPVIDVPTRIDATLIVGCEFRHLYEYMGKVVRLYGWDFPYFQPSVLNGRLTFEIKPFEQEAFYQHVLANKAGAPLTMMSQEKINFLLEMLRFGLTFRGDVIEVGCWQGGSTWYLAKALKFLGERRSLYMLDLFEEHMMDPWATMSTSEVQARMNAVYDNVSVIVGLVDAPENLAKVGGGALCFAHIDLGYQEPSLEYAWRHLSPGAPMVLDNYGHIAAPTWMYDEFFERKGTRVTRLPWSEQGLVFKRD